MSPIITDPEFLSELSFLKHKHNFLGSHTSHPYPKMSKFCQNTLYLSHPKTKRPSLFVLRCVYTQAKLSVEGANLNANIENERLLQEYRVELAKWKKKQAAECNAIEVAWHLDGADYWVDKTTECNFGERVGAASGHWFTEQHSLNVHRGVRERNRWAYQCSVSSTQQWVGVTVVRQASANWGWEWKWED